MLSLPSPREARIAWALAAKYSSSLFETIEGRGHFQRPKLVFG